MSLQSDTLLTVENLRVEIATVGGSVKAVRGIDLQLQCGETLAIVGESGCGKSISALSLMGLLPEATTVSGSVLVEKQSLLNFSELQWRQWRGNRLAMIFQNPMTALNPTMRIGQQIAESLILHRGFSRRDALQKAEALLDRMYIPNAKQRLRQYPFEFSGGMLQRVVIAMSVACEPDILIADEPTTALDVTVQAEVLSLLQELQRERNMGLILITHDLAVVAQMAQRVAVMYAGQIVEQGGVEDIFYRSAHPYTQALLQALPDMHAEEHSPLMAIAGSPPDLFSPPEACSFCQRCDRGMRICQQQPVPFFSQQSEMSATKHDSRCWLYHPQYLAQQEECQ